MLQNIILFVAVLAVRGTASAGSEFDVVPKIVGGIDAPESYVKYQVSLRSGVYKGHFCGGSIIEKRWILTATHCFEHVTPKQTYAVVGTVYLSKGGDRYDVQKFVPHPNYNRTSFANDIGLVKTTEDIKYTLDVQPIAIASKQPRVGKQYFIAGWGYTDMTGKDKPDVLQYTYLRLLSLTACRENEIFHKYRSRFPLTDIKLCTLNQIGQGICQGDSGSALVDDSGNKKEAIGIGSYNSPCARGVPDVFTNVYKYRDWIMKNIN